MDSQQNKAVYSVLVVDDSSDMRVLLSALLGYDYRVRTAQDASAALALIAEEAPDLILLDAVMPGMNGYTLCERIKDRKEMEDVPIIFISALDETGDKVRAFDLGAVDYVTKPIQGGEVQARVAMHLKLRQLQSELRNRNEMLKIQYDEVKRLEKLKDDLTHMIIHDMRTPLGTLSMGLSLVEKRCSSPDPDAREFLAMARTSSQQLSTMVNALLDVVRLESGEMSVRLARMDLRSLAEKAVDALTAQAAQNNLTIRLSGDHADAMADAELMQRVFENLIGNALRFSSPGGGVDVVISAGPDKVRIEIRDSGHVIPPEYLGNIFEKFSQVSARAEHQKHSTGLGLTFCKLAIEAQGGRIGVASEIGKGSTFWFELPSAER